MHTSNPFPLKLIASVIACAGIIVGCSSNDDDDDGGGAVAPLPGATALSATDLEGGWSTGCVLDDPGDVADGYEIERLMFTGGEFTATAESFSDAGCTVAVADDDDIELEGSYTLGSVVMSEDGLEATEIDFIAAPPSDAAAPGTNEVRTLVDLVSLDGDTLYLGEGDFDDIRDVDTDPRPVRLDILEPYIKEP